VLTGRISSISSHVHSDLSWRCTRSSRCREDPMMLGDLKAGHDLAPYILKMRCQPSQMGMQASCRISSHLSLCSVEAKKDPEDPHVTPKGASPHYTSAPSLSPFSPWGKTVRMRIGLSQRELHGHRRPVWHHRKEMCRSICLCSAWRAGSLLCLESLTCVVDST
jgi:hypothetical protein